MIKLYEDHGERIFEHSLWRKLRSAGGILEEAYSHQNLEAVLQQYFAEATLRTAKSRPLSPPTTFKIASVF